MADVQKIIDFLTTYKGDLDSLNEFVALAASEYGDNWVVDIQNDEDKLPAELKGRYSHAYNYHCAKVSWEEIQDYLNADHLDIAEMEARIPVLEYWLKFFGQSGQEVVTQLRQKLQSLKDSDTQSMQVIEPIAVAQTSAETTVEPATVSNETVVQEVAETPVSPEADMERFMPPAQAQSDEPVNEEPVQNEIVEQAPVLNEEQQQSILASIDDAFPSEDVLDTPAESADVLKTSETTVMPELEQPVANAVSDAGVDAMSSLDEQLSQQVVERSEGDEPLGVDMPVMADVPVETETIEEIEAPVETVAPVLEKTSVSPKLAEIAVVSQPTSDPALFVVDKIDRQLALLHQVQAWVSARCVALKIDEPYKYTYYGFLMDMSQQILDDIDAVLADESAIALLQQKYAGRLKKLQDAALALKSELDGSKGLFETNPSPLINQNMSADAARSLLGGLDISGEKEYLGPAPDGFEMLDDPYETETGELDEDKLKSDYEKIEDGATVSASPVVEPVQPTPQPNAPVREKGLDNSPQKGVERKKTVSLGVKPMWKKPAVGTTDAE